MYAYQHRVFVDRIVKPAREVLEGRHLSDWIESSADRLSPCGLRSEWGKGPDNSCFKLSNFQIVPHAHTKTWTASIRLSHSGHDLSILRVAERDRTALMAHELGHAMLFEHEKLWRRLAKSKLIVDPAQERLVDDIARSLMLPKLMFDSQIANDLYSNNFSRAFFNALHLTNAPVRFVLARLLQFLRFDDAIAIHLAIPMQRELFSAKEVAGRFPNTRWLFRHTSFSDRSSQSHYPFVDFVRVDKPLRLAPGEEEALLSGEPAELSCDQIERYVRKSDVAIVRRYSHFRVMGSAPLNDTLHVAVLGLNKPD